MGVRLGKDQEVVEVRRVSVITRVGSPFTGKDMASQHLMGPSSAGQRGVSIVNNG